MYQISEYYSLNNIIDHKCVMPVLAGSCMQTWSAAAWVVQTGMGNNITFDCKFEIHIYTNKLNEMKLKTHVFCFLCFA